MKIKFTIVPYTGSPRTLVWDCLDRKAIDSTVEYLMADTTGNTKSVQHTLYIPAMMSASQTKQANDDADLLCSWYSTKSVEELNKAKHEIIEAGYHCAHTYASLQAAMYAAGCGHYTEAQVLSELNAYANTIKD